MPRFLSASFGLLLFPLVASAQAVPSREPTSTHIFPAGGQRGTVVKVRVGGECLPPNMAFKLDGPGVSAPPVLGAESKGKYEPSVRRPPRDADGAGAAMSYPRVWDSTITIAPDAALGTKLWRVSGAWGGTRPRPFLVGDLPEHIETESNSTPERAERIALPIVINGQIAGERDQDFFTFSGHENDVVVFDVMAARIGSPLDPVITITDGRGLRQDVQQISHGGDPVVAFRVRKTGDYRLHVANLGYGGGPAYVYRITASTRPFVAHAFPAGGRSGETIALATSVLTGTREFKTVLERVPIPNRPGPFLHGSYPLLAGDFLPEAVESEENHTSKSAQELRLPVTLNGRFATADEEDWFRFSANKGELYSITCEEVAPAFAASPVMTLTADDGAALLNASAAERADRRIRTEWRAPADGKYLLRLRDLQHGTRGGGEFIYRLTVQPARPGFALRLEADSLNVVQGGRTEIDLDIQRTGDFTGPIDLSATGLPEGVKFEPARVGENLARLKLAFTATVDTRPADVLVALRGTATIDGKPASRIATATSFGTIRENLHLTVQHQPLFRISCNEAYQYAPRGSIFPYPMTIERLNGFSGPITLQLCERQVQDLDGIEVVQVVVPPGAVEAKNRIYLPETMHAGVQHHSRPYVQGYASFTDRWGTKQTILAVCEKRCMVRTMPPVVKLRATATASTARPGEMIECKLALERTTNFTGPADIELVATPGAHADAVHIESGSNEAVLRVKLDRDVPVPLNGLILKFRATGPLPSGTVAVSEATIALTRPAK